MFIEDVITKIWEPISKRYEQVYNEASKKDKDELYNLLINDLSNYSTIVFQSRELNMTALPTTGCPHFNRNGKFLGCSFCDYNSLYVNDLGRIAALRDKSVDLYAKLISYSFTNSRGKNVRPGVVELITCQDSLNEEEFPKQVYDELFSSDSFFKRKPYKGIFETRVTSVTLNKLLKWKEKLGRKIVVEFGVEVGNEWIRNHWLNKGVTDEQIIKAINIIHEGECEASGNILIGIPCLTEQQSIELFKESYKWIIDNNSDHILCSPLIRKPFTLQGYIYKNLKDDPILLENGIVHGEHTGLPSIFTIFYSIYELLKENESYIEKMALSPANFPPYFKMVYGLYKESEMEEVFLKIKKVLEEFRVKKDFNELEKIDKEIKDTKVYQEYCNLIEKQKQAGSIQNTVSLLSQAIIRDIWPDNYSQRIESIEKELAIL